MNIFLKSYAYIFTTPQSGTLFMDKPSPMTLLDELTTPVQFRILKLLLPFFSFSQQRMLATWIKFSELQRTLELFSSRYTFSESPLKSTFLIRFLFL